MKCPTCGKGSAEVVRLHKELLNFICKVNYACDMSIIHFDPLAGLRERPQICFMVWDPIRLGVWTSPCLEIQI